MLPNQIFFFIKEATGCLYNDQRPAYSEVYFRVHASCPEHPNSQDVPEKSLGDYSVDHGKDSARTIKMQQYSLHFNGQDLLKLLV